MRIASSCMYVIFIPNRYWIFCLLGRRSPKGGGTAVLICIGFFRRRRQGGAGWVNEQDEQ